MTQRKRLEGTLADWHPHPKEIGSLAPVVRDGGVADEIADRFFDSAPEALPPEPPLPVEPAPRRAAIESAAVRARRRYLMRYVAGAVSVAGVIGLAAVVRMTTARDASAAGFPLHAAAASLPAETAAPTDDPIAPPDPPAPTASADPASDPAVAAAAPTGSGAPANPALDALVAQDPPPPDVSPRAAADAKRDAQRALDRGRLSDAIEAGEESIALDPTDADAWLLLGAAYMQKGRLADARHCFSNCVDQARRGDRWECRALLR
jgi:tetratricopeptide (TPR) repeat protein